MAYAKAPARRTQAQRTAEMKDRLLDATIATVVERGYADTTIHRVAHRAGVSPGAAMHHFAGKAALVSSALHYLAEKLVADVAETIAAVPARRERLAATLDAMWASFNGPLFEAAIELWVAARTDRKLRAELEPLERELAREIRAAFDRALDDELVARPDFHDLLEFTIASMRGLAMRRMFDRRTSASDESWRFARRQLIALFDALDPDR